MGSHALWLIERSKLFRECLKTLLDQSDFNVCLEASRWSDLEGLPRPPPTPELILLATPEPPEDSVSAIAAAADIAPVIILAETLSLNRLRAAMRAGASGFLVKDISSAGLQQSLRLILTGEKVLPTELATTLFDDVTCATPREPFHLQLSQQENAILSALVEGNSNKTIARGLKIAEGTVKVHVKSVFKKIGVQNRTEAAVWAIKRRGSGADEINNKLLGG